jgi:DNA-binding GntR family transcriptional regulator
VRKRGGGPAAGRGSGAPRTAGRPDGRSRGGAVEGPTLAAAAYTAIEAEIVTLRLAPGSVVSEQMLSERLGIGRTPIREALQQLARERLVTILPRRGVVVSAIDVRSQLRLLEVRREVERLVARSAALRATAAERKRFVALASAFEKAARVNDDVAFLRVDREFNELCVAAARNDFAEAAMSLMSGLSRRFWYLHYRQAADMPVAAKLHADVARAIGEGDADAAGAAHDRLIDNIEAFTRATVDVAL